MGLTMRRYLDIFRMKAAPCTSSRIPLISSDMNKPLSRTASDPAHRLCHLFYLFIISILFSCSSPGDDPGETGSLSLTLQFPQTVNSSSSAASSIISASADPQYKAISDRCTELGITELNARVYDEDNNLLARGGPWSCDAGRGSLTRVKKGDNRSVYVNLNNNEGRLILTGKKSNIKVIPGKVAEAVIEIDFLSSEEVVLDALNDSATVTRGSTLTVLDSGYTSLLHNDIAPDSQTLTANTQPISGPSHGSLTIYEDGTFSYRHNGGNDSIDSFTYEAKDAHGGSDIATVTIYISSEGNTIPVLSGAGVSPETGDPDTSFTFSIRYRDQDGHGPAAHSIYIDGNPHLMTLASGDTAWDGIYTYTTKLPAGTHRYYYSFSDGHGGSARLPEAGSSSGITVAGEENHAPVLTGDSLSPQKGFTDDTFTYSVHYLDPDNDPAKDALVYIDGVPHAMTFSSGSVWDGTYSYSTTTLAAGKHTYYFSFTDGKGGLAQLPAIGIRSGPSVSGSPTPPTPPVIENGTLSPNKGSSITPFTYSIHYSDPNGDSPSTKYVYIDQTAHEMFLTSGTASNGVYSFSTTLAPGTHSYYFSFSDGKGGSARLPYIDSYSGPSVNYTPVLSGASVTPGSGTASQTFTYSVQYSDKDGQEPSTRYVYIDGTPHTMSFSSGVSRSNGIYAFQTTLGYGSHTYYFLFSDGNDGGTAREPKSGYLSGPTVNTPPSLGSPTLSPEEGTSTTIFTFGISYSDPDSTPPQTAFVYIDGTPYAMTLSSGSAFNGTYAYQCKLSSGAHSYYFLFTDGSGGSARYPAAGTATSPAVHYQPELKDGTINADEGTTDTLFTYSVHYYDRDNDIPQNAYVYIDSTPHLMTLSSGTASDGTYSFSTKLSSEPHTYSFSFTDALGDSARLPSSGTYTGPSVSPLHVVYVDPVNGHTGNSGRSWSQAVPGIQEAVDVAFPGDQIWVRQGTYLLTRTIDVNKDLSLYGGFIGSERYLSERDFSTNTVSVDGQGAIRCFSLSGAATIVTIDGICIQNGNGMSGHGGGINNTLQATLGVFNCTFRNNTASQGGGINNYHSASQLTIVNCLFENNSASTYGGGVYCMSDHTDIARSVFQGNTAGYGGGGVGCRGSEAYISNSLFWGNTTYSPSWTGSRGGGIAIWGGANATATNCTIYGNQATYKGGAIYCENSSMAVWNSIIRANSFGVYNRQVFSMESSTSIQYSDVELGLHETPWDPTCIDEDPTFSNPASGDFRLKSGSPCIDKGNNDAPNILDADLAGYPRILGIAVDMGAYEFSY